MSRWFKKFVFIQTGTSLLIFKIENAHLLNSVKFFYINYIINY